MGRQVHITENTNPNDIYVKVKCQETGKAFRIGLDGAYTQRTCRCSHETFEIYAEPHPGWLDVEVVVTYKWGSPRPIENFDVLIDKSTE